MSYFYASQLEPADVFFSREPTAQSCLIQLASMSPVSHAFVYSGNNKIIQASGGTGVTEDPLSYLRAHGASCVVYRYRGISPFHRNAVVRYCRRAVGRDYDFILAALSPGHDVPMNHAELINRTNSSHRSRNASLRARTFRDLSDSMYCSQLVALAFESAGIPIVYPGEADRSNPGTMRFAHVLEYKGVFHR